MKNHFRKKWIIASIGIVSSLALSPPAFGIGYVPGGCGTLCLASMRDFCPTCYANSGYYGGYGSYGGMMPWGTPSPYWWQTGPMMYSNFYQPAPWYSSGMPGMSYYSPGVMGNYYPGGGGVFAAKPNLYLIGAPGTQVSVKIQMKEEGANWLAAVPAHGQEGWKGTLNDRKRIVTENGAYRYLYSDYRLFGQNFQDQNGFCADRKNIINKMALELNRAGFSGRELADFIEYWSVKLPASKRYCVYPQDERQLNAVAPLEVTPKPVAIRRVLFMVQVGEGLTKSGHKFTSAPKSTWTPEPLRMPASEKEGLVIREWGVGFFAAGEKPVPATK